VENLVPERVSEEGDPIGEVDLVDQVEVLTSSLEDVIIVTKLGTQQVGVRRKPQALMEEREGAS